MSSRRHFWTKAFFAALLIASSALGTPRAYSDDEIVFDFESGDFAESGWVVSEGECSKPLGSRDQTFHFPGDYPKQGKWYLTSLESTESDRTFESNVCVLESPVFVLSKGEFSLMVGGGDIPETWLELCEMEPDGSLSPLMHFHGKNEQSIEKYALDLSRYLGKPLLFRLVDRGTGAWSYLHADDFRGTGQIDVDATNLRRDRVFRESAQKAADALQGRLSEIDAMLAEQDAPEELIARADALKKEFEATTSGAANSQEKRERYIALERRAASLERETLLKSDVFAGRPILYVSRVQYPYEHHNTETTYQTDDICTHLMPESGSALKIWRPETDETTVLLSVPQGLVRDPCVSYDADRVLMSIRWNREDDFHLYELDLSGRDLSKEVSRDDLKQLTFGSGVSDIGPQYLPDGRIVFSSTREPKYCMCNRHIMHNLYTMNGDGSNILQIGHSTLFEGDASIMPDGRVLYFRWEYVDRNFSDAEGAWTVNPDGTNHALYWGNNTESPAATVDPRVMPDEDGVFVCTMTGCHISPWGAIAIVDRKKGLDDREPVREIWPPEAIELIGTHTNSSYDALLGLKRFYEDPLPLDSNAILASGTIPDGTIIPSNDPVGVTGLWLLTTEDNGSTLVHTDPVGCFDATILEPTAAPPIVPSRVDLTRDSGEFYVVDVNQGFKMDSVPRGKAKYLRVVESPEKRFWTNPSWWGVDAKGAQQAPAMNWDDFGNKRILGVVPIEEDGSVYFTVPADKFVFFQLLDENMETIQSMRSGVAVRPGETNGCFGCHEDRLEAFPSNANTIAMQKAPQKLNRQFDRDPFLFSYTAEIQPIWDKYCVVCHDDPTEDSSPLAKRAGGKLALCGDLNPLFNRSYWELRDKKLVDAIGSDYAPKRGPLSWGAQSSVIMKILREGHDAGGEIDRARAELGVGTIDPDSIEKVATWIDLNAPYYPDFSSGFPNNPYGRSPLTFGETDELAQLTGCVRTEMSLLAGQKLERPLELFISFTRPERSRCLDKWTTPEERETSEYKRALELIRLGAERLAAQPREDMPGWKLTNPIEIRREAKYEALRAKTARMQQAVVDGVKLFDKDDQPEYERCMQ